MHAVAQNDDNALLMKWVKSFKIFLPKNRFLAKKMPENDQKMSVKNIKGDKIQKI